MNRNATATILLALAIGVYFTVTRGILEDVRAVRAANARYTDAIESAERLIDVRDEVMNSYNNISQNERERLEKILPSNVDNIRLIIDLNSVALRHGFSLRNIKATMPSNDSSLIGSTPSALPGTPEDENIIATPTLDRVGVSFSVTAPYQQFINFMQDIEANLRLMEVTHLSVKSSDTGVYDFMVELETYWLRQ